MQLVQNRLYLLTLIGGVTTLSAVFPFLLGPVISFEASEVCSTITNDHGHTSQAGEDCWLFLTHEGLHISAITLGVFLMIISVIAYYSTRNKNMVWTILAFLTFIVLSVLLLHEDMNAERVEHTDAMFVDVLLTVMIGFFGIGVFSNQKFPTRRTYD